MRPAKGSIQRVQSNAVSGAVENALFVWRSVHAYNAGGFNQKRRVTTATFRNVCQMRESVRAAVKTNDGGAM